MKFVGISLGGSDIPVTSFPFGFYDFKLKLYDREDDKIIELSSSAEIFNPKKLKKIN